MTTAQLQIIHRRMLRNLQLRHSVEQMLPAGPAKDSQLLELDEEYYQDLKELNRLCPEPSVTYNDRTPDQMHITIHDQIPLQCK